MALVGTDLLVHDVSEHELELVENEVPLDVEMSVAEAMTLFDRRG